MIVICGVSGSGKSSVGRALAQRIAAEFIDADDFHSEEAKLQMAQGIALTDEQRGPWVTRLSDEVRQQAQRARPIVLAFSGLRRKHRKSFYNLNLPVQFVLLSADADVILSRLAQRKNHFMPVSLLRSQFDALEKPGPAERLFEINALQSVPDIVNAICEQIVSEPHR